jgi:hypothetical protein
VNRYSAIPVSLALFLAACSQAPAPPPAAGAPKEKKLIAKSYNSGFAEAHDTYNGMGTASDGRIFYVLSSEKHDVAARMFSFDPATKRIQDLGDLASAAGEKDSRTIVQGKSHVNFVEGNGKLYFSTHIGFYSIIDGMEMVGVPPAGWKPYAGGHFLAYDLASNKFEDYGVAPNREGIITTNTDVKRGRLYGLTWPTGTFVRYDLAQKEWKTLGEYFQKGENGKGAAYRVVCRSLAIDPADGSVYFSTGEGWIYRYKYDTEEVTKIAGDDLKKDYFGLYEVTNPGHMAYNWRQVFFHEPTRSVYGVHGNSGYLFKFVPSEERVEVLDRITSEPSKRAGMFDQFSYGYLGFALGPDGQTIYYLTGGPVYVEGKRVKGKDSTAKGESKGTENLHLVTWRIPTGKYTDHGPIFYEDGNRPSYVNSIAVGKDGTVYSLGRVTENGKTRADLFSVKP